MIVYHIHWFSQALKYSTIDTNKIVTTNSHYLAILGHILHLTFNAVLCFQSPGDSHIFLLKLYSLMLPRKSLCTSLEWINTNYLRWFKSLSHVLLKMQTLLLSTPYFALSRENTATGIGPPISLYYRWGDQGGTGLSSRFLTRHRHRRNVLWMLQIICLACLLL